MKKQKTILITGASSGIGKALAILYAEQGVNMLLTGRNEGRLREVENLCFQKGAAIETSVLCVTNRPAFEEKILEWDDRLPIDMLIANAGISGGSKDASRSDVRFREVMDVNLDGTFNTINPMIPRMIDRKSGHIVLMSSMAGFRGMPNAPAYSVSKVAVRAYGDALRPLLKRNNITVSTIFPGFVKTPLTDVNGFKMPFIMEVDRAAEIIRRGLDAKKASIAFPFQMHALCWLLGVMPRCFGDEILKRAPKKEQ
ncbi:MAG: SDR family NAD(P)-dependent oxidoreductase [Alphaproteobacteria bacterium]|nr:SDR family NAD(P)-dependent oxidoreductase [Alphaproteobacteria bacterium]MCK5659291.1 SDR family NAD(P)-dependent oxidoreductase [Alphaproteobacteria bacterium]